MAAIPTEIELQLSNSAFWKDWAIDSRSKQHFHSQEIFQNVGFFHGYEDTSQKIKSIALML